MAFVKRYWPELAGALVGGVLSTWLLAGCGRGPAPCRPATSDGKGDSPKHCGEVRR